MIALGIDPTDPRSKNGVCAFAVIDFMAGLPLSQQARRLVALGTLERGRECDELCEMLSRRVVEAVAVEVALDIYQDAKGKNVQARRAITRALLGQNVLAGELLRTAVLCGVPRIKRIESTDWHRAIGVHSRLNETYDAAVHRSIRLWVRNWPVESSVHERDAAGVCLGAFASG